MIYAVVGAGPRTGTSWTMKQLDKAGLPVYWSRHFEIPGAEYETLYTQLPDLNHVIAKVWPPALSHALVGRMLVLKRDFESQVISLRKQIEREASAGFKNYMTAEQIIERSNWIVDQSKIPRMEVETKDLSKHIDEIVNWFSEPFEQMRIA